LPVFLSHVHGAFGVGVILGEPTGLSLRVNESIVLGIAGSIKNDHLHLHCDYWWKYKPIDRFHWFAGLGVQFAAKYWDDKFDQNKMGLGVRVPLGLSYMTSEKLELFGEVVPVLFLAPHNSFELKGGIGVRYYFNLN
jgi:hypothetical protein